MTRKIRYRDEARSDLRQIGEYTRREWGAAKARAYLTEIAAHLSRLGEYPSLGAPADLKPKEIRKFRSGKHVIFYIADDDAIEVVRVPHERMDFRTRLR